jgi:hypothetical protein
MKPEERPSGQENIMIQDYNPSQFEQASRNSARDPTSEQKHDNTSGLDTIIANDVSLN